MIWEMQTWMNTLGKKLTTTNRMFIFINIIFSVRHLDDPLIYGSIRDNGLDGEDSDDSDDSNAENNWRNDYPDESDMESINEDDMVDAMKNVCIDEDLLSSDSGEEGFVYR